MTPPPSLQELIETVRHDAGSAEPLDQLVAAVTAMAELTDTADAVLGYFVDQCRRGGRSWTEISAALGVSKQAAHKRFSPESASMERFTPRARTCLEGAVSVARELGHGEVGTEHLLLGLYASPEGIAGRLLLAAGATQDAAEAAVLARSPRGDVQRALPPFTPAAADVVTGAIAEALQLGHNYVGTEHLLLALFRDADSAAAQVLAELGLAADRVRTEVVQLLASMYPGKAST